MLHLVVEVLRLIVAAEDSQQKVREQYAYHELQVNDGKRRPTMSFCWRGARIVGWLKRMAKL
jgi:hypothetical protein